MTIREACLKAKKDGRGITRKSYGQRPPMFLPTNTASCVLLIPFAEGSFKTKRWNPNLDDLIATDWYVYG